MHFKKSESSGLSSLANCPMFSRFQMHFQLINKSEPEMSAATIPFICQIWFENHNVQTLIQWRYCNTRNSFLLSIYCEWKLTKITLFFQLIYWFWLHVLLFSSISFYFILVQCKKLIHVVEIFTKIIININQYYHLRTSFQLTYILWHFFQLNLNSNHISSKFSYI